MDDRDEGQVISIPEAPGDLKVGDYAFASRWSDADPGDPWHVGHVSEVGPNYVVIGELSRRRWPRAMNITHEQGNRICERYPALEMGPSLPYAEIARCFNGD